MDLLGKLIHIFSQFSLAMYGTVCHPQDYEGHCIILTLIPIEKI